MINPKYKHMESRMIRSTCVNEEQNKTSFKNTSARHTSFHFTNLPMTHAQLPNFGIPLKPIKSHCKLIWPLFYGHQKIGKHNSKIYPHGIMIQLIFAVLYANIYITMCLV